MSNPIVDALNKLDAYVDRVDKKSQEVLAKRPGDLLAARSIIGELRDQVERASNPVAALSVLVDEANRPVNRDSLRDLTKAADIVESAIRGSDRQAGQYKHLMEEQAEESTEEATASKKKMWIIGGVVAGILVVIIIVLVIVMVVKSPSSTTTVATFDTTPPSLGWSTDGPWSGRSIGFWDASQDAWTPVPSMRSVPVGNGSWFETGLQGTRAVSFITPFASVENPALQRYYRYSYLG
jgi:hypothetical protein